MIFVITEPIKHPWIILVVYVDPDYQHHRLLWMDAFIIINQGLLTLIIGDFNCIDEPSKRLGGRPFFEKIGIREFQAVHKFKWTL